MHSLLSKGLIAVIFLLLSIIFVLKAPDAKAESVGHVVISEVSIAGDISTDEFVELYNPTDNNIDLTNWRLTRKTSTGTESTLVSTISGTIQSHGYFLITHPDYASTPSADQNYSEDNSISSNNTVLLYSDSGNTLVDKVGFGTAQDSEGASETNPANGTSRERKANSSSTTESMGIGGDDEFTGNGEDTDNNADDFILRNTPQPQNSESEVEPEISETPTNTPTETPTPTESETPTPTITESPTPTETPSPTVTIEPSPKPVAVFPNYDLICTTKKIKYRIMFFEFYVPLLTCRIVSH